MYSKIEDNINEVLTSRQYAELFADMGFGIELEMQIFDNKRRTFDKLMRLADVDNAYKFMGKVARTSITSLSNPSNDFSYAKIASELGTSIEKVENAILDIKEVLNSYGPVHTGSYSSGQSKSCWRAEADGSLHSTYGTEVITANVDNKGMSYVNIMKQVPKLCQAASIFGFGGYTAPNDGPHGTGLHVHISYKGQITVRTLKAFIDKYKGQYSLFSLLAYLTTQESEAYLQQGDYERKFKGYTQTFLGRTYNRLFGSLNKSTEMLSNVNKIIKEKYGSEDIDKDLVDKELVFKYGVANFLNPNYLKNNFEPFEDVANEHFRLVSGASHSNDYSARSATIENRMLGGENGFNSLSDPKKLDFVLKLAIRQLYPYIDPKPLNKADVIRSTEIVLRETLLPYLNAILNKVNFITNTPNWKAAHTTLLRQQPHYDSAWPKIADVASTFMSNDNYKPQFKYIFTNTINAVEASKTSIKDDVVVVKDYGEKPAKRTSPTNRMLVTNAVTRQYKVDNKVPVTRVTDINVRLTRPTAGATVVSDIMPAGSLTADQRAAIRRQHLAMGSASTATARNVVTPTGATVRLSRSELRAAARNDASRDPKVTYNPSGISGRSIRKLNKELKNPTPTVRASTARAIAPVPSAAPIVVTPGTRLTPEQRAALRANPNLGATTPAAITPAGDPIGPRTQTVAAGSVEITPDADGNRVIAAINPNATISGTNSTVTAFDPNVHQFSATTNRDLVIHLGTSTSARGYYYIKFMKHAVKKGKTVSFEYGPNPHQLAYRYIIGFPSDALAAEFFNKLTRAGVNVAVRGHVSDRMYHPTRTLPSGRRASADNPQVYRDAAMHGPIRNSTDHRNDTHTADHSAPRQIHHIGNATVQDEN